MLFNPKIKPRLWNLKPGIVAHNCDRVGLPMPAQAYAWGGGATWPDLSGNKKDGTVVNALWKGGNLHFDGTGDYVDLPDVVLTTNYTLSFLAKVMDSGGVNMLAGDPGGTSDYLYCMHNTRIRFHGSTGATEWTADVDLYNRLREYTLVVDSAQRPALYLDGVFQYLRSDQGTFKFYAIGKGYSDASYDFEGSIHRVILFPVALSSSQVATFSNDPYGMFEPIRDYRIWSFITDGETFYKSITGNQPASTGSVATVGIYEQKVAGSVPNPVASIVKKISTLIVGDTPTPTAIIVKKTSKEFTGEQPNPTGSVVAASVYKQTVLGDIPNPEAVIVKETKKDIVGDVPNPIAIITKKISIQVAGNVPTTTAVIVKKTEKELIGEQVAPAGSVVATSVYKQSVAGSTPATTGSLDSVFQIGQALAGNMPASLGNAIRKISKMLAGSQPTTTGDITKQTEKNVTGGMPSATGSVTHTTKTFLSGIMGNITGIVSTILNPIPSAAVKLCKLIGSCFKKFLG